MVCAPDDMLKREWREAKRLVRAGAIGQVAVAPGAVIARRASGVLWARRTRRGSIRRAQAHFWI